MVSAAHNIATGLAYPYTIRGCDVSTHFKINAFIGRVSGDAEGRDIVPANVYSRVKDVVTVFD
jgi:hypothetical protein